MNSNNQQKSNHEKDKSTKSENPGDKKVHDSGKGSDSGKKEKK